MPENYRTVKAKFNVGDVVIPLPTNDYSSPAVIVGITVRFHSTDSYETAHVSYSIRVGVGLYEYDEVELAEFVAPIKEEKKNEVEEIPEVEAVVSNPLEQ